MAVRVGGQVADRPVWEVSSAVGEVYHDIAFVVPSRVVVVVEDEEEMVESVGRIRYSPLLGLTTMCTSPQRDTQSAILSASTIVNDKRSIEALTFLLLLSMIRLHACGCPRLL